jgi:hypothetical protein
MTQTIKRMLMWDLARIILIAVAYMALHDKVEAAWTAAFENYPPAEGIARLIVLWGMMFFTVKFGGRRLLEYRDARNEGNSLVGRDTAAEAILAFCDGNYDLKRDPEARALRNRMALRCQLAKLDNLGADATPEELAFAERLRREVPLMELRAWLEFFTRLYKAGKKPEVLHSRLADKLRAELGLSASVGTLDGVLELLQTVETELTGSSHTTSGTARPDDEDDAKGEEGDGEILIGM